MSCLEYDEHYIVTFPNGYGRLAYVIVLLPTVQFWYGDAKSAEGRERDERWGLGEGQEKGWKEGEDRGRERETVNREREDLRIFIANFLYIKGTCRESIK